MGTKLRDMEERMAGAGVDIADGIERSNDNEALYIKLLKKFNNDKNYGRFMECMEKGEYGGAAVYIHTLKGLSANLGMKKLYECCRRADEEFKEGRAATNTVEISENYLKIVALINEI